jgi:hypothetical protein
MESKLTSVEVIFSDKTLSKWRLLVGRRDSFLELPKKLANLTGEFLWADYRDLYPLVRE